MEFINDINLKKQARELGVKIWQTPGFLFMIMGIAAAIIMTATYYISQKYNDINVLIISESLVAITVIVIGNLVVHIVEQMARLNKMKNEFVSVASHQLRTPLSAIKWEVEVLTTKQKKGLNAKQLSILENINNLSFRMTRLVNDLLDVARIDQKRLILRKEPVDLVNITNKIINEVETLAKSRNIEISFNVAKKKMPLVLGDPERLKLVVENLISNSIKYITKRGKIDIKLVKKDSSLIFSIRDNGVGIPEEQQDQIFDKFFRSDNIVKYQTEGTGLGLYITKNIIEQSGGKIWFQSIENVGSEFSFSLPIK